MINSSRLKRIRLAEDDDDPKPLDIPEDVLFKVFSWLPVKSLVRFRCVSKRWNDVISSDPYFIQLHSQQSKSKPPLLFSISYQPPIEVEENVFHEIPLLLQSSRDMEGKLLSKFEIMTKKYDNFPLMLPTRFSLVCFISSGVFYVCNPSTHQLIELPPLSLTYEDYTKPDSFGFGYVESKDEYKVVHLFGLFDSDDDEEFSPHSPTLCRVVTLGMRKEYYSPSSSSSHASPWAWRNIGNSPYHVAEQQCGAFVEGALHWVINRFSYVEQELMIDFEKTLILALDLETEEFRVVPGPMGCGDLIRNLNVDLQVVELRGLLCLSCLAPNNKMEIWMLKDYHNENRTSSSTWFKEYSIDLCGLDGQCRSSDGFYVPREIEDGGNKVLIDSSGGVSFHYHLESKTFSGFVCEDRSFFTFYTESLHSLGHVLQAL